MTPLFDKPLHVGKPHPVDREALFAHIGEMLDSGRLANDGPKVKEFEARVCGLTGARYCITTCNGTMALQILARALDLRGEVIMPAFTFIATAHAMAWIGLKPVFADVDPITWTLDPVDVRRKITKNTCAILGVHLWGWPCRTHLLAPIAEEHGLHLFFDAAHAFGCEEIGCNGVAETFSFHATKVVSTFEGGAVVTNDDVLAVQLRQIRSFGFVAKDQVTQIGTNAKLSEVAASMGLVSLDRLRQTVSENRGEYAAYRNTFGEGFQMHRAASTAQWAVVEIDEQVTGTTRDALQHYLWGNNVLVRRYFYPGCHRLEPYRSQRQQVLPVTERLLGRVLSLPTGAQMPKLAAKQIAGYMMEKRNAGHIVDSNW